MAKLLIVCGPTATGKTDLALKLAKKFKGELVNADSRQVYRGLNIGTGKDLPSGASFHNCQRRFNLEKSPFGVGYYLLEKDIPIWLLDVVTPDYNFNVADYLRLAVPVIKDIWARGKLPILVGGTGFYLQALIVGVGTAHIPQNKSLRQDLVALSQEQLQTRLLKDDPAKFASMNNSDRHNPRRLIRAIEVADFSDNKETEEIPSLSKAEVDILWLGLKLDLPLLDKRIDQRVKTRLNQGLLTEIEGLLKEGYSFANSVLGETLAYAQWRDYFSTSQDKNSELEKAIWAWKKAEKQYARRQMTWFRKNKRLVWFDVSCGKDLSGPIAKKVKKWYINNNG
jgi:tRNA dimethylallyltransferase